jgi:DNA-binding NtrC family response regulator
MCETLADILEDKGYDVGVAQDGVSAVERMKAGHFDLIPYRRDDAGDERRGDAARDQGHQSPGHGRDHDGHSQLEGMVSEALWTGADGILYKPFDVDAVIR